MWRQKSTLMLMTVHILRCMLKDRWIRVVTHIVGWAHSRPRRRSGYALWASRATGLGALYCSGSMSIVYESTRVTMRELTLDQIQEPQSNANDHSGCPSPLRLRSSSTSKTCAWCGTVITEPYTGGGHGICYKCFTKVIRQAQIDGYIGQEQRADT